MHYTPIMGIHGVESYRFAATLGFAAIRKSNLFFYLGAIDFLRGLMVPVAACQVHPKGTFPVCCFGFNSFGSMISPNGRYF